LVSAAFVGIAFNVKMLVAFGVVPIFALVYLVAVRPLSWGRLGWLSLAGVVLAAISLSWSLAYDLTSPADRPFAGSSDGNSMLELAVGHNGVERFARRARTGGQVGARVAEPGSEPGTPISGRDVAPAGPLRLVAPPLAAQIGWQFPIALAGGLAAWLRAAGRTPQRLAIALWAGWAVTYGVVLSAAGGLFHAYYLAVMAPALCALAGIGSVSLYTFYRAGGAAAALLPATIAATALWQAYIVDFYREASLTLEHSWLIPGFLAATGVTCAVLVWARQRRRTSLAVAGLSLFSLLGFPAAWSLGTAMTQRQTGFPAAQLPNLSAEAENGRWRYAHLAGALAPDPRLLDFLERRRRPGEVLLATVNTRQAAPFIIATGAPVLALGGFNGHDPVVMPAELARLVADKRIRFVLIGDGSPGIRRIFGAAAQRRLTDWILAHGRPVDPSQWRSTAYPIFGGVESRAGRPAEMVDSELYDLRPEIPAADLYVKPDHKGG
jgi:4-amino-4-deoxy-L-arabinose transferase-like glycosyltransferase